MRPALWSVPLFLLAGCSLPDGNPTFPTPAVETAPTPGRADRAMPTQAGMVRLAQYDHVACLYAVLDRYDRDVRGIRATLIKQERIRGKLNPEEHITVSCAESPFRVLMEWDRGVRLARRSLYIEGENK